MATVKGKRKRASIEAAVVDDDDDDWGPTSVLEHPSTGSYRVTPVIVLIVLIQLVLPDSVTIGPLWLVPAIEVLGAPAGWLLKRQGAVTPRTFVIAATTYLTFLVFASVTNAVLLLMTLLNDRTNNDSGEILLFAGFGVLAINTLSFALIYWWVDGGGPKARRTGQVTFWDFQYPQQAAGMDWTPKLGDYIFTAYTNIIAFSPTDTMPLSHRVKLLFGIQSAVSLVTVLVTVSRAINMLT